MNRFVVPIFAGPLPANFDAHLDDRWFGTQSGPEAFGRLQTAQRQENIMFSWAIAFLIIALIAGALGFGVVAGTAFAAAKIIFVVALLAFLISAVLGLTRRSLP
jgi:uncharacterized membrane protein YtjA (UPF0391 family)